MNTKLFAGGVMAMAVVGAVAGGVNLGQLTNNSFDYASATEESRHAFLKSEADAMSSYLRRNLISPSGVGPTLHLGNVEVDASVPEILYSIDVKGPAKVSDQFGAIERQILSVSCQKYLSTVLGKNHVRLILAFMQKDTELERIVISEETCRKLA